MDFVSFNLELYEKYITNFWCIHPDPLKVLLKVFSILIHICEIIIEVLETFSNASSAALMGSLKNQDKNNWRLTHSISRKKTYIILFIVHTRVPKILTLSFRHQKLMKLLKVICLYSVHNMHIWFWIKLIILLKRPLEDKRAFIRSSNYVFLKILIPPNLTALL